MKIENKTFLIFGCNGLIGQSITKKLSREGAKIFAADIELTDSQTFKDENIEFIQLDINDENFDSEVLESDKPVLIDFWAEWCGPCKVLGPVIDEVASDYSDKVKFVKLNIDHNPSNTQKYGIRGIPTLILFKNGEKADTSVGVLSKSELSSFLDKNL